MGTEPPQGLPKGVLVLLFVFVFAALPVYTTRATAFSLLSFSISSLSLWSCRDFMHARTDSTQALCTRLRSFAFSHSLLPPVTYSKLGGLGIKKD